MTAADRMAGTRSTGRARDRLVVPLDGAVPPDRELFGGKASSLLRMAALGVPVPPAFTLTTEACRRYQSNGRQLSARLWAQVLDALDDLEARTGRRFGGEPALLVSVRSGAPVSMPGMMDTLLNVGLTRAALAEFGEGRAAGQDTGWVAELAEGIRKAFADAPFAVLTGRRTEEGRAEALAQLRWAIARIFDSWHNERAEVYRRANGISEQLGTAVTVQAMVFGNRDDRSGTGVYLTRNPVTGANEPYGEWLPRAQGESLVSGERSALDLAALRAAMPDVHSGLVSAGRRLEAIETHPVEIEFTVESGQLYFLQARRCTRTPQAAVRWAVELVGEGLIGIPEALDRVDEDTVRKVIEGVGSAQAFGRLLASGTGVVPGRCCGLVVDDADEADRLAEDGQQVILARPSTSPHDIHGFLAAAGVITERGGGTSHAAVVARQIGVPCVVGCGPGVVAATVGRVVTIDGTIGAVYDGALTETTEAAPSTISPELSQLSRWRAAATAQRISSTGRSDS
ncbi:MAG TPA: pyruvate, phosphate dikinase [Pseudonocardiaceae bacterium]|jgi:pyruvate,orthophosphate dikinase|nr:pyruvate, phosphate dikinase [Pseudonocardiaceae bacterium]